MCPRILAAAKIPQDWSDLLDQRAQDEGKSRSQIIQKAIAEYLNQPFDQELTLASLALEVDSLKRQLSMLSISSEEIAILRDRLSNIKQDQHPIPSQVPQTDNPVNYKSESARLVNQFLKRQRLGKQSSKAKFLIEFVKYLESQG